MEIDTQALSRRGLVAGGAALGAGALLTAAGATAAGAAPPPGPSHIGADAIRGPASEPAYPRLGSALIGGYTYVYRDWLDFESQYNNPRKFGPATGSRGVYSDPADYMGATVDLPPGAYVRDVEYYVSATTAMSLLVHIWTTGQYVNPAVASATVPAGTANLRAVRIVLPASANGPYAAGAKLQVYAYTNATQIINGARIGLSSAPTGTVMLATPTRVYDSRSGAKIGNGQTRIHSLASYIPAGATAAIVNLTATSGEKSGGLAIYNTGSSLPSGSLLYYNGGTTESNEVHCKLPSDRKVKVTMRGVSGCKVHYFIDVLGYTA